MNDKFTLVFDDNVMPRWDEMVNTLWEVDPHVAMSVPCLLVQAERRLVASGKKGPDHTVKRLFEEIKNTYNRMGVELVSKVLDWGDKSYSLACFKQIEHDLAWNDGVPQGAWTNEHQHLHFHMVLKDQI